MEVLLQGNNLMRLLQGVGVSFSIALISIACSIVIGTIVGLLMTTRSSLVRLLCRIYLESVRLIPILALLYVCYFGLPQILQISISNVAVAVLVFSFWGGAEMADLVRGALTSVPRHYKESALSLGLSPLKVQIFIVLPIANKRLLPGLINLFTRMIKTTALLLFIGIADMLQVGRQIIAVNRAIPTAAFAVYGALLLGYFAMCFPLSALAKSLEKRAKA